MNTKPAKWKTGVGVVFVLAGIGVGTSALLSGPRAFAFGITAVVLLCVVAIALAATGAKMIYDSTQAA